MATTHSFQKGDSYKRLLASNASGNPDDISSIKCEWQTETLATLAPETVRIHVQYSSINYKDALAITGKGKILRSLPLTPGIDAAGTILDSSSAGFSPGDEVVVTGCGLGENTNGGLAQIIDVPSSWVISRPKNLTLKDCMILGTAGFTAGLAIHQLELNGLNPSKNPVLVTGATGGVGSLAILMLKNRGYKVEAWSRKESEFSFLKKIGADTVTNILNLNTQTRALESSQWAAAIDNVGGDILSFVLPRISPHGSVASIGLAKSEKFQSTVFPFILRGVNILGISSATCPRPLREKIWSEINALSCDWKMGLQNTLSKEEIIPFANKMISGKTIGRTIVDVASF
ncbi:MAG: acryloyl-CoA reductase [Bdellovibrionaceae bacterium]|nr:acryloyl-CoA reductase [Pseudobdellovibrionaceae bacterium]